MAIEYKLNEIKVDLANYRHYWRGIPKIGKTTLFRDFIMELYGSPKYGLLLSLGRENGYSLLNNLTAEKCEDWYRFVEVVDDLVENKANNEFKFVCLDTVDRGFEISEKKVLEIHQARKGERCDSIDAALGGFTKGKIKAKQILEEQVDRLEKAGYGMVWIGHSKPKQLGDQVTDTVYEKVTGSLEFKYDSLFSDRADFSPMIASESIVDKNGKLKETKRYIYFRSNPNIDAGSRVGEEFFPEKIEYSAKGYIETVTKAIEAVAGVSGKVAEKQRKQEQENLEQKGKEFGKKEKEFKYGNFATLEEYKENMMTVAKSLSPEDSAEKKSELKRLELPTNIKAIEDFEIAKKVYAVLNS
jgi:hypothetical protein